MKFFILFIYRSKAKIAPKTIDTGAGFFIEETEEDAEQSTTKVVHPKGGYTSVQKFSWPIV